MYPKWWMLVYLTRPQEELSQREVNSGGIISVLQEHTDQEQPLSGWHNKLGVMGNQSEWRLKGAFKWSDSQSRCHISAICNLPVHIILWALTIVQNFFVQVKLSNKKKSIQTIAMFKEVINFPFFPDHIPQRKTSRLKFSI